MRKRGVVLLLVVLIAALVPAPASADGYLTARGLYDDCSDGAVPGFDLERQEQRRKCENFLQAVSDDWVRSFPPEQVPPNAVVCPRDFRSRLEAESKHGITVEYPIRPKFFLEYWDGKGFGLLGGLTVSARAAVPEFLNARMIICSSYRAIEPVDPLTLSSSVT